MCVCAWSGLLIENRDLVDCSCCNKALPDDPEACVQLATATAHAVEAALKRSSRAKNEAAVNITRCWHRWTALTTEKPKRCRDRCLHICKPHSQRVHIAAIWSCQRNQNGAANQSGEVADHVAIGQFHVRSRSFPLAALCIARCPDRTDTQTRLWPGQCRGRPQDRETHGA